MAQTHEGAMKVRAAKLGMSLEEYLERCKTEKWCVGCKKWHPFTEFGPDKSRHDGLTAYCRASRVQSPRKRHQRRNQIRAHRLIQMRVKRGTIANPNTVPCLDCGHIGSDRRHEYDHFLGYETPEARGSVQAVCSICHNRRERIREHG